MAPIIPNYHDLRAHILNIGREGDTVLASGIFDVLHVGHVRYLKVAAQYGLRLLVALNGDARVRALKGEDRPLVPLAERMEMIAAFRCVDYVTSFEEDTPTEMIRVLRPRVFAKGTDYNASQELPEECAVLEVGAKMVFCGDPKTHGSRDLIARMGCF